MEIKLCTAPFDAEQMLCRLEEIFGIEERLLETPQLTGLEISENKDIVLCPNKKSRYLLYISIC